MLELPVIAIWGTPRSVTTAFERAISNKPEIEVVHEPFTDCYYFGPDRVSNRYGDASVYHKGSAPAVREEILSYTSNSRVAFKELAFQGRPYLTHDFMKKCRHTFMIRDPRLVYGSLSRLKPDFTEDEFGFSAIRELFDKVVRLSGQAPLVVDGTRFQESPEEILRQFCSYHGISYSDDMLSWRNGAIRNWEEHERLSQARWHHMLENSRQVLPPRQKANSIHIPSSRSGMVDRAMRVYEMMMGWSEEENVAEQRYEYG